MQPAFDQKTNLDPVRSSTAQSLDISGDQVEGESVDCDNYGGPIYAIGMVGAASGSPSAQNHEVSLEESDDGSTGWTAIDNQDTAFLTADNAVAYVRAHRTKRYVRTVCAPDFTDGSSPDNDFDGIVMGQLQNTEN